MASTADEVITVIAFPESIGIGNAQADNEAQLAARWNAILNRTDLSPGQRLTAEREFAKFNASRTNPAEGNGKLFVDTAKEQGSKIVKAATSSLFDELLPVTSIVIVLAAFAIFLRFGTKA